MNRMPHALRQPCLRFVEQAGQRVSTWFIENESGATLKRPETLPVVRCGARRRRLADLNRLTASAVLNSKDWENLKSYDLREGYYYRVA